MKRQPLMLAAIALLLWGPAPASHAEEIDGKPLADRVAQATAQRGPQDLDPTVVARSNALSSDYSTVRVTAIRLQDGLVIPVPDNWKRQQPRLRMIEHEFSVPAAKGDNRGGRVTIMIAGGGVDANLARWYGQFTQPDGSNTKDKAVVTKLTVHGKEAVIADISGTYQQSLGRGPFAPGKKVPRENYRMLGAIVPTQAGTYFFKFTGPAATVKKNAEGFRNMVKGLRKSA